MNLIIFCFIAITCYYQTTQSQNIPFDIYQNIPKKFGFLTSLSINQQQNLTKIQQYLKFYQENKCQLIEQINIICLSQSCKINNQQLKQKKFNKNINFYPQTSNKIQQKFYQRQKFRIPIQSKSKIYFLLKLDDKISCQELSQKFLLWKKQSYGQVGPLVGYNGAGYSFQNPGRLFNKSNPIFKYTQNIDYYYSIVLMNRIFVSRSLLNLFYINLPQIQNLRLISDKDQMCMDIVFNVVVSHFYPQLKPLIISNQTKIQLSSQITQIKSKCLLNITKILGYNPLINYYSKNNGLINWRNPSNGKIINAKSFILRQIIQSKNANISNLTIISALSLLKSDLYLEQIVNNNFLLNLFIGLQFCIFLVLILIYYYFYKIKLKEPYKILQTKQKSQFQQ